MRINQSKMYHNCKFWLLGFACCLLLSQHSAFAQVFSDSIRLSLVTGSPGKDLYAQFGHTAIRVVDHKFKKDYLFNYGTFNFDAPNFYWNFVMGRLNYQLSLNYTDNMADSYQREGRALIDQEILLEESDKRKMLSFLLENYRPENRGYLYDFYYDNCTTRARDILEQQVTNFNYRKVEVDTFSFRQALDIYTHKTPWVDFGMDLILGTRNDLPAGLQEQMFLPELMMDHMTAFAYNGDQSLLGPPIYLATLEEQLTKSSIFTPLNSMLALFLLTLLISFFAPAPIPGLFDRLLFFVLGLMGLFFLFLWFGTEHPTTERNWNIAWANPLFILLPFWYNKKDSKFRRYILWAALTIPILLLLFWTIIPQQFHIAFLPIWGVIVLRAAFFLFRRT